MTGFCNSGTPTSVQTDGNAFIWQCLGTNGGNTDGCLAYMSNTTNSGSSASNSNLAAGAITVTANTGFITSTGQTWNMRGLDATVQDALQGYPQVMNDYPGLTAIRLNVDPNSDSTSSISQVVQEYNSMNVVVEIEDHMGTQNENNVGWYSQMANLFKNSPLVFLEVPNEPKNSLSTTTANQVGIINAIREAGFINPIGLQPLKGYDESNIAGVVRQVGTQQLFVTPHIYYDGNDTSAAAQWADQEIQGALSNGLYVSIDEFGNSMDGVHMDPVGYTVIDAVIAANNAGKCGALFWAMDNGNHADGADSAFLRSDGSQLTSTGQQLMPWLSKTSPATGLVTESAGLMAAF